VQDEGGEEMIDKSVVKRLAVQCGLGIQVKDGDDWSDENFIYFDNDMTAFANAIAAHQRKIDADICANASQEYECDGSPKSLRYTCEELIRRQ
jgi:hypothetical protein